MLIKIYFRCKPIYKSVTQKKLPSYKSKVYIRDNFFVQSHIINNQLKILNKTKHIGKSWIITIFEHMVKNNIEKRYLILKLNIVKKQDPNFSKNRCYISKLKMVKKQILPSVNIGITFQNSIWFKENKILPSAKIDAMYIWKLNMVRKRRFTFSKNLVL